MTPPLTRYFMLCRFCSGDGCDKCIVGREPVYLAADVATFAKQLRRYSHPSFMGDFVKADDVIAALIAVDAQELQVAAQDETLETLRRENAQLKEMLDRFSECASISCPYETRMRAAEGALERLRAAMTWQPIESCPKMRTVLLFAVTDVADDGTVRNWKMATGSWHTGYEDARSKAEGFTPWNWDGHQLKVYELQPTHWMPLPSAPERS